ncbi:PREDICTED: uncharacterized protein C17orf59 homolog [Dipodomys ordii]|uniref:Uncharacterized protein C17orf59 homolog n=1 Tax=Dipodomys ordii TaxID=10020 RepID=A0A1S3EVY0_DIPOR|nr:PREDICTED: uncharacterized protein C17orf59 homolog [Dipodomys ordii]
MESSRGRLGSGADLLAVGEQQQAAVFSSRPSRMPSKPPSVLRVSGEEEAEKAGIVSRPPRATPKVSQSGSVQRRPEAWPDEPGPREALTGTENRRRAPASEHGAPPSLWHPDPEPPEDEPASERVCRRGSPGGVEMNADEEPAALAPAPARPGLPPAPASSIPPIDPDVLRDLERLSRELGGRVDRLLRGLGGAVQELTALSVGCIQTYRDAVDSLGEAVDMSIKGMYTLLARCEELERALQPVQGLARQVRDIRRTLEVLEALCK